MDKIRTLIVDDEYQARKGLRALLAVEPDIEVIGECGNGLQAIDETAPAEPLQRFFIKTGGEVHFTPVDEVDWLEADGYCTRIHAGKKAHLLRGNLGSFEARLDPKKFTRINRSAIINLNRVQSLKNWFHGECLVVLPNGIELKVSEGRRRQLEYLLERLV